MVDLPALLAEIVQDTRDRGDLGRSGGGKVHWASGVGTSPRCENFFVGPKLSVEWLVSSVVEAMNHFDSPLKAKERPMRHLFGGMTIVASLLAIPCLALADEKEAGNGLFTKLDANQDGQVTKDEVPEEKQRMFERLLRVADKDENGQLSAEEMTAGLSEGPRGLRDGDRLAQGPPRGEGRPDGRREGRGEGRPDGPPGPPNPEEMFKRVDANGDGSISKEEFVEHHKQMMERMRGFGRRPGGGPPDGDRPRRRPDGDGAEGRRGPGGPPRDGEDGPRRRERDGDDRGAEGRGRGAEGRGPGGRGPGGNPEEFFKRLDKNEDGKLTVDEAPEEGRERFERMMERQDKDGDKAISKEEFMAGARARMQRGEGRGPEGRRPEGRGEGRRGRPEGDKARPPADDDVRNDVDRDESVAAGESEYGQAFGRIRSTWRIRLAAFASEKEGDDDDDMIRPRSLKRSKKKRRKVTAIRNLGKRASTKTKRAARSTPRNLAMVSMPRASIMASTVSMRNTASVVDKGIWLRKDGWVAIEVHSPCIGGRSHGRGGWGMCAGHGRPGQRSACGKAWTSWPRRRLEPICRTWSPRWSSRPLGSVCWARSHESWTCVCPPWCVGQIRTASMAECVVAQLLAIMVECGAVRDCSSWWNAWRSRIFAAWWYARWPCVCASWWWNAPTRRNARRPSVWPTWWNARRSCVCSTRWHAWRSGIFASWRSHAWWTGISSWTATNGVSSWPTTEAGRRRGQARSTTDGSADGTVSTCTVDRPNDVCT